ncbi:MAG: diacylglycerol/lipid kinase family protein [Candidatus Limnocylindrales bacterium]
MSGRLAVIDNPRSFRGGYPIGRVRPILEVAGWEVTVLDRLPGVSVRALVEQAIAAGASLIVSAGGDGTLRDVASAAVGTGVAVGILPGGTTNVFARELGIPSEPEGAAEALIVGVDRPIDLGRLTLPDGRWARFLIAAGLGLDGAILAATRSDLKRRVGPGAIALAAVAVAPRWRAAEVTIRVDGGERWSGSAWQLIAGNTRLYANLVLPNPEAQLDDGLLDLCVLPAMHPTRLVRLGLSVAITRVPPAEGALWFKAREFEVTWGNGPPPVELDGTPVGGVDASTVRLSCEPGVLLARLPSGDAGGLLGGRTPRANTA